MHIQFGSHFRSEKNRTPMQIAPTFTETPERTEYSVFDEKDSYVGRFTLDKNGNNTIYVGNLEIPSSLRGKKTAANILFSIRDFIAQKAKDTESDCIQFDIKTSNPHNLSKLYKKLYPDAILYTFKFNDTDYTTFSVPLTEEKRKKIQRISN